MKLKPKFKDLTIVQGFGKSFIISLLFAWSKSNKKSRLYNNAGGSKPEVSPRNTRHEREQQILTFYLAGVLLRTFHPHDLSRPCGIPPPNNRWRIFIMPVPSKKVFTKGNNSGHGLRTTTRFSGCRERHYKISVVVRGWFFERGAFQTMQK